jgi:hypothetical protein
MIPFYLTMKATDVKTPTYLPTDLPTDPTVQVQVARFFREVFEWDRP